MTEARHLFLSHAYTHIHLFLRHNKHIHTRCGKALATLAPPTCSIFATWIKICHRQKPRVLTERSPDRARNAIPDVIDPRRERYEMTILMPSPTTKNTHKHTDVYAYRQLVLEKLDTALVTFLIHPTIPSVKSF